MGNRPSDSLISEEGLSDLEVQILTYLANTDGDGATTTEISPHTKRDDNACFSASYVHMMCRAMMKSGYLSLSYLRDGGTGRPRVAFSITDAGRSAIVDARRLAGAGA